MHKIKRFFSVNTKRALKISADTLVLRIHDIIDFFTALDEIYLESVLDKSRVT